MSLFDFVKDAGAKLFGGADDAADTAPEMPAAAAEPAPAPVSAGSLHLHIKKMGLAPDDLSVGYADGLVTVSGTADSQETREKIVLALGNVAGVGQVDDRLTVAGAAVFYTVQSGDTLGGISKDQYGSAGKYMVIFEANRPMLENPDLIYPGQVLRIPPLED